MMAEGDSPMAATARRLESQFRLPMTAIPVLVPALPSVESAPFEAVEAFRKGLDVRIGAQLTSGSELLRALDLRRSEQVLPTALPSLDALLDGGLPRGKEIGRAHV